MDRFERSLVTEWRKLGLPAAGETIVVAVSGGADSLSVMLALAELNRAKKLRHRFVAAHFDHRLRPVAGDSEAGMVAGLALARDFEFVSGAAVGRYAIPKKGNLEQNARASRYRFLADVSERTAAFGVVTGHTMNDRAETLLMNLIRGSGRQGLSSMTAVNERFRVDDSSDSAFRLIRPLLGWALRQETEAYCRQSAVDFLVDPMNADPRFTRVRIRNELIPMLESLNPRIVETLAGTAESLREIEPVGFETEAEPRISDLAGLHPVGRAEYLRAWLEARRGNLRGISLKHIRSIERLIDSPKSGRLVEMPGGCTVVKGGGKIVYQRPETSEDAAD